jgi:hypothetical protein
MDSNNINDVRVDFKNITFSGYQKSKVKNEFIKSMYDNKIENACYWCAEFICAGHYLDVWNIIIFYTYKYIHSGNPKLAIYLNMRYNNFLSILKNGYTSNILPMRNNNKVRKIFCEIICIVCFSNKKNTINEIKLDKSTSFDLISISEKFKAPHVNYINNILRDDDPKELIIPVNELIYNLVSKNIIDTYYWFEWILEYENICKKKKKKCIGESRMYAPTGFANNIIWIIWDILFYYSNPETTDKFDDLKKINNNSNNSNNSNNLPMKYKIINELFGLFTIRYNASHIRKRKSIIYFAFSLLIDNIDLTINIINNTEKIEAIVNKIDAIYKDIKKNEVSPNTDYLFTNLNKSNLEKTIEKIEMINNM